MSTKRTNQKTEMIPNVFVPNTKTLDAAKMMGAQRGAVRNLLDTIKNASNDYIAWRNENDDSDLNELRQKNFLQIIAQMEPELEIIQLWDGRNWVKISVRETPEAVEVDTKSAIDELFEPAVSEMKQKHEAKSPLEQHKDLLAEQTHLKTGLNFKTKYGVELMLLCLNCFKEAYAKEKANDGNLGSLILTFKQCTQYVKRNKRKSTQLIKGWEDRLLKSLIDDAWLLGHTDTLTVKPFSKGIEGWVEGWKEHPSVLGEAPIRITKYMKP